MYTLLPNINNPQDLKKLSVPQLALLAKELREFIVETVASTGGHLAPSLGVVELTLVLHYLYNSPRDKIVWDVGHQAYVHKIITGRRDAFKSIRQYQGISGFPKISESEHDAFGVGHASTAISAALGIATARDIKQEDYHVLAVVGDGALTGGLSYEGLNNAGASGRNFVVILNDNTMSISPNVGAMSRYLTNLITHRFYNRLKSDIWEVTGKLAGMGEHIRWAARKMEESLKAFLTPGVLFERLGFRYFGPIDGHNIAGLIRVFNEVKSLNGPILVHVLTKKGKGYSPAEDNASQFHGLGKFDPQTGQAIKEEGTATYTQVFGRTVKKLAEKDDRLVAITAAMSLGTGLSEFAAAFPDRFFDVGIAEGHAVTFAAGLATQGYKPIVAIYSSFLQRSYDQIIHDVALQNLGVIFALDRGGLVGDDGPTHHGVFDIAYLRTVPNMTLLVPKDENELSQMLYTAVTEISGPVAIRYPRGQGIGVKGAEELKGVEIGKSEVVRDGEHAIVLAAGPLVYNAIKAAELLEMTEGFSVKIVNLRSVKPIDRDAIRDAFSKFPLVVTLEEGTLKGGAAAEILEAAADMDLSGVEIIRAGIPDAFVGQGSRSILLNDLGLGVEGIVTRISNSRSFVQFQARQEEGSRNTTKRAALK